MTVGLRRKRGSRGGGEEARGQAHLNGMRGIHCDLVVGLVPVRQPKVVVLGLDVHVREDELRHQGHGPSAGLQPEHPAGILANGSLSNVAGHPSPAPARRRRERPPAVAAGTAAVKVPALQQGKGRHLLLDGVPDDPALSHTPFSRASLHRNVHSARLVVRMA